MSVGAEAVISRPAVNFKAAGYYLVGFAALYLAVLIWGLFHKPLLFYLGIGAPVAAYIVCSPRLALFQYIFVLFISQPLAGGVYLMDIASGLAIGAALIDAFSRPENRLTFPRLSLNYICFYGAIILSVIFAYWPSVAFFQLVSVAFLIVTFWAVYRLVCHQSVGRTLGWFLVLAVAHSVYVLVPFIMTGGEMRSFGLAPALFGHIAEAALPIMLAIALCCSPRLRLLCFVGVLIILGGLVATQSRAPIAFGLATSAFVVFVVWRKSRRESDEGWANVFRRRLMRSLIPLSLFTLALAVAYSDVLMAVLDRFGELFTEEPSGTFLFRLILWKKALLAFSDSPIFGVGPGGYKLLYQIYPHLRFDTTFAYLNLMTAHNLMLHYLAETGLLGASCLAALMINKLRLTRYRWRKLVGAPDGTSLALYAWAFLFILSGCIDAAWMYGQLSFLAVFFSALVARQHDTAKS